MNRLVNAYTKPGSDYPGFVNLTAQDDGSIVLTVRGDPTVRDGIYICGYDADRGKPGRCTAGDERCNNYCNMAPSKGPMADRPLPCTHVTCGETVAITLTAGELAQLGFAAV